MWKRSKRVPGVAKVERGVVVWRCTLGFWHWRQERVYLRVSLDVRPHKTSRKKALSGVNA